MKIKTSELIGNKLDWAVAKCEDALHPLGNVVIEGKSLWISVGGETCHYVDEDVEYSPSSDWAQGGPIIERELIRVIGPIVRDVDWIARIKQGQPSGIHGWFEESGPTPLVAAMRCYVASKLGEEVETLEALRP